MNCLLSWSVSGVVRCFGILGNSKWNWINVCPAPTAGNRAGGVDQLVRTDKGDWNQVGQSKKYLEHMEQNVIHPSINPSFPDVSVGLGVAISAAFGLHQVHSSKLPRWFSLDCGRKLERTHVAEHSTQKSPWIQALSCCGQTTTPPPSRRHRTNSSPDTRFDFWCWITFLIITRSNFSVWVGCCYSIWVCFASELAVTHNADILDVSKMNENV